jgi:predicted transcriptional regulator
MALQLNQSSLPAPARLVCYWAVRELGMTAVAVARFIGITQSAVTQEVGRGEMLANDQGVNLFFSRIDMKTV